MKNQPRKFIVAGLLMFALGICQNAVFAQTATPINFAAGKTSTVVTGKGSRSYMIRVGADQTCKIRLISARNQAMLEVLDEEGMDMTEGSDGRAFEGSFGQARDLKINVTAKSAFTLKITIK